MAMNRRLKKYGQAQEGIKISWPLRGTAPSLSNFLNIFPKL